MSIRWDWFVYSSILDTISQKGKMLLGGKKSSYSFIPNAFLIIFNLMMDLQLLWKWTKQSGCRDEWWIHSIIEQRDVCSLKQRKLDYVLMQNIRSSFLNVPSINTDCQPWTIRCWSKKIEKKALQVFIVSNKTFGCKS